jgi:hypothetical protein
MGDLEPVPWFPPTQRELAGPGRECPDDGSGH